MASDPHSSHSGTRIVRRGVAIVFLLLSVSSTAQTSQLIGYWELVEQPFDLTIEFKDNGTYVALTVMGVMSGHWELVDENHLATWNSSNKPKRVSEFTLGEGSLTIIEADGTFLKHRKMGPSAQN